MAVIEAYNDKDEAFGARDYYNHELKKRATVCKVPDDNVEDFGGGGKDDIFKDKIEPSIWLVVVEK